MQRVFCSRSYLSVQGLAVALLCMWLKGKVQFTCKSYEAGNVEYTSSELKQEQEFSVQN